MPRRLAAGRLGMRMQDNGGMHLGRACIIKGSLEIPCLAFYYGIVRMLTDQADVLGIEDPWGNVWLRQCVTRQSASRAKHLVWVV